MLSRTEFFEPFNRLAKFFNKKLDDDQLDVWFDRLKHLQPDAFKRAINDAIDTEKTWPSPSVLITKAASFRSNSTLLKVVTPCDGCNGEGVRYMKKGSYNAIARCGCLNGDHVLPSYVFNFDTAIRNGYEERQRTV